MSDRNSRPPKVTVQQHHLDAIDLIDALSRVLGQERRDVLLGDNLSGLKNALLMAIEVCSAIGNDKEDELALFRFWLSRVEAGNVELGFSSLSEIRRVRALAQARYLDYRRHGN